MPERPYVYVLTALALAVAISACGADTSETASAPPPADGGPTARTYSKDAQLGGGARIVLLSIPRIGALAVRCGESGGLGVAFPGSGEASVAFRAASQLPTANVVVTTPGAQTADTTLQPNKTFAPPVQGKLPYSQTWSVAPYAEARVRVTTIFVALRKTAKGTAFRCAASAQATVGPPGGSASG